jgi:hypothetical protein
MPPGGNTTLVFNFSPNIFGCAARLSSGAPKNIWRKVRAPHVVIGSERVNIEPNKSCRLLPAKNVWVYYSLLKSYFQQMLKKS